MEQRLIDANDINVEDTIGGRNEFADCIRDSVECVLNNAPTVFTIPENPTNGDMIKAVFPNAMVYNAGIAMDVEFLEDEEHWFNKDWWNAPYKAESEEEE